MLIWMEQGWTGTTICSTATVFKNKVLSIICPPANSVFGIYNPTVLPKLTQLSVCLCKLTDHIFRHNFRDTVSPMCSTNYGFEDINYFLLLCRSFDVQKKIILFGVDELVRPFVQIANLSNLALIHLLLHVDYDFSNILSMNIIELTRCFIHETGNSIKLNCNTNH